MGQKTLINGTAYDTKSGKCLVDGTGYAIKKGRTRKDGTVYDIKVGAKKYTVKTQDIAMTTWVTVDGVGQAANTTAEAAEGAVITLHGSSIMSGMGINFDGQFTWIGAPLEYTFSLASNVTIRSVGQGSIQAQFYVTTS